MRIRLLGPVVAERCDGASVPLGGAKQKSVLVMLALQPRVPVSSDALCDAIWGESLPPRPHRTLSVYVSTLRSALGSSVTAGGGRLLSVPGGYSLDIADSDVDLARFRDGVQRGRRALAQGRPDFARKELAAALAEWRGTPLEELLGLPFAAEASDALLNERVDARELAIQATIDLGRAREVIGELDKLTVAHPLREGLWAQLMLALYLDGRQAQALETFTRARQVLVETTGLDPHPDLVDLERRILAQDDNLRPRPPRIHAGGLPRPLTRLVGRESLVADLVTRMQGSSTRLLTLTGPGGVGKTHLALEVAHLLDDSGRDVRFVDCSSVQDDRGLVIRLTDALGLDPPDLPTGPQSLSYQGDPVTLVVDNLEQLAAVAGRLLGGLLERSPSLTVLATSRLRLGCSGEQVLTVPPLGVDAPRREAIAGEVPPAVRMFVSRVDSSFPDVRLDDQLDTVGDLCRTLGGLPLAIELAAAQARTMTPRQIHTRLRQLFASTTSGRTAEPLRASIESSLRLLPDLARQKFPLLAIFAGGFTLEAVEAVCVDTADTTEPAAWVADLVDASLVQPVEAPSGRRLVMLEPLRMTAAAMGSLPAAMRSAHARHYITVGQNATKSLLAGTSEGDVHLQFVGEEVNWAQALRWTTGEAPELAVELLDSWMSWWSTETSARHAVRDALEGLEMADASLSARDRARLRVLRGGFDYLAGDLRDAMQALRDGAAELERLDPGARLVSRAYCWLAATSCTVGEAQTAREAARHARRVAEASGITQLMSVAWDLSAFVAITLHDLADAETAITRSLELCDLTGDSVGRGFALSTQGDLRIEQGRTDELRSIADEVLRIAHGPDAADYLELWGVRLSAIAELEEGRSSVAAEVLSELIPRYADAHGNIIDALFLAVAVMKDAVDASASGAGQRIPDEKTLAHLLEDLIAVALRMGFDLELLPRTIRDRLPSVLSPPADTGDRDDSQSGSEAHLLLPVVTQRVMNLLEPFSASSPPSARPPRRG